MLFPNFPLAIHHSISCISFWTSVLTARWMRIVCLALAETLKFKTRMADTLNHFVYSINVFGNFVVHKIIHSMHTTPVRNYAKREIPFKIQNNSLPVGWCAWKLGTFGYYFVASDKWPKDNNTMIFDNCARQRFRCREIISLVDKTFEWTRRRSSRHTFETVQSETSDRFAGSSVRQLVS